MVPGEIETRLADVVLGDVASYRGGMNRLLVWLFVLTCVLYAAATAWAAISLPQGPIPTHWSGFGDVPADGWSSRSETIWLLVGIGAVMAAIIAGIIALFVRFDSLPGLNVPNKEYWIRPENLPQARARAIADVAGIGAATMALMITVSISIVQASHDSAGRSPGWIGILFAVWFVAVIGWTVWMVTKRWAIPPGGTTSA